MGQRRLPPRYYQVYFLRDPRDGRVRYVGSASNLQRRFYAHCRTSDKCRTPEMQAWLKSLEGQKPVMQAVTRPIFRGTAIALELRLQTMFHRKYPGQIVNTIRKHHLQVCWHGQAMDDRLRAIHEQQIT